MLTVSAKDFGPIIEGTVNLKPLTVFVGPSNTGKSYMATAVHVLVKAFRGRRLLARKRRFWHGREFLTEMDHWAFWGLPDDDSLAEEYVERWARQLDEQGLDPDSLTFLDTPEEIRVHFEQSASSELSRISQTILSHFQYALGEPADLIRKGSSFPVSKVAIERDEPFLAIGVDLINLSKLEQEVDITQVQVIPSPMVLHLDEPIVDHEGVPLTGFEVFYAWASAIGDTILQGLPYESFYLPAARSGITQGYKILAAELVRRFPSIVGQGFYDSTLPGITTEFLGNLIGLDRRMLHHRHSYSDLTESVTFIENSVLQGQINLDESGGLPMPEIAYFPNGKDATQFSLNQTSSMVSELAPLILFLKYLVNPGDLLILEEPESHLHPAAQRQMARGIVRLVNAGVKVLITTHSDYFLNQVNNLLRISFASDRWLKREGFAREDCLKHDDVSAYAFEWDEEEGGSRVRELEIRKDVGIDDEEFGKVVNAQYEETILVERIRPKW